VEDTISILRGLKERYEVHHGVRIEDAALVAAAVMSDRYIADRFLPDKAIDLVDESAARLKMEMTSKPAAIDRIDRKILQLQMEKLSLTNDDNPAALKRLASIDEQMQRLQERQQGMMAKWQTERDAVNAVQEIKKKVDACRVEIDKAEGAYDLSLAAKLKYQELPALQKELATAEAQAAERKGSLMRDQVPLPSPCASSSSRRGFPKV
jgi:ATP-dependent Clp protease ATP-binding subunit ClpB